MTALTFTFPICWGQRHTRASQTAAGVVTDGVNFWEETADCFGLFYNYKGLNSVSGTAPSSSCSVLHCLVLGVFYFSTVIQRWYGAMAEKQAFWCGISQMKLKESLRKEKIISVCLKKSTLKQAMKNTAGVRLGRAFSWCLTQIKLGSFCESLINGIS